VKSDHREPSKPFHIQRKRLGVVKYVKGEGEFGFIDAEDFREDVFFHNTVWQGEVRGIPRQPLIGAFVEFEIDEEYRTRENKLRASVVRLTDRPMGKKLTARDAPHLIIAHHPKARRKRPTWREETSTKPPAISAEDVANLPPTKVAAPAPPEIGPTEGDYGASGGDHRPTGSDHSPGGDPHTG